MFVHSLWVVDGQPHSRCRPVDNNLHKRYWQEDSIACNQRRREDCQCPRKIDQTKTMDESETAATETVAETAPIDAPAAVESAESESPPAIIAAPEDTPEQATAAPADVDAVDAAPATPQPPPEATLIESTTPYLKRKDKYVKPETEIPEDVEFQLARAFLLQNSEKSEMNLYDHLTLTMMRVLETRPKNAIDMFESISSEIKRSKFRAIDPVSSIFRPVYDNAPGVDIAKAQVKLFEQPPQDEPPEEGLGEIPDVMDLSNLWEWAGVSFGREETFLLFLSLRKLVAEKPLKSVRLWGKIFGTGGNYIITEGELKDGATDEEGDAVNGTGEPAEEGADGGDAAAAAEGAEPAAALPVEDPTIPKPKTRVIPPLPREIRVGVNRYVYYVCAYPGASWIRLPDVIPEKLQISRQIRKHFTGNLKHQIISYPKFEADEAQYLRCQIARISAATVASPSGYYMFDPEDEGNEEEGHQPTIIINPEFEGLQNDALLLTTNWVHHVPYVLPQGRTSWVNPYASLKKSEDEEGGDEDEEKEEGEGDGDENPADTAEPETGPPLLSPLVNDDDIPEGGPAWVSRACSSLSPIKFTPVTLRSTRWPGAIIVAYNDKFANIYVGDGHGDIGKGLALKDGMMLPPVLPDIAKEFVLIEKEENPDDPENPIIKEKQLTEQKDPTVEEENAFEEAKRAKEEEAKDAAEEGEEAAEEEED
ncbi:radial spokehead-like protein-domain-containing protein [Chytriomyces sp. MP71]|nr:radial spokehead-like protein-domain-containing protein [Chytriomyces sp. MP71]